MSPPRMQCGLRDNFYGSGSRPEDESLRQRLVKEQKLCRVRSQKFSLETNRRRKAWEERRRLWDAQEQRRQENVLQQRRQRVQDATERFQRAHLPPPQRWRQDFRMNIPTIEDALSQIQGSLSSRSRQASFSSSDFHVSSRAASPQPPAVPKSSSRQALSAVEAYTKLLQEQTCMTNGQEPEKESQTSDSCNSDSLSCKDSLEIKDFNPNADALQGSSSSFLADSENAQPVARAQSDPHPKSDLATSAPEHEESDKIYASRSSWKFAPSKMADLSSVCNIVALCKLIRGGLEYSDVNSPQTNANHNVKGTNRVSPSNVALQIFCQNQEALLELTQHKASDDRQLKHPSATEILLPAKNGSVGSPPKPNIFLSNNTISHEGAVLETGKGNHYLSSQKEAGASINNLNKVSASASKSEKPVAAGPQPAPLSNAQSEARKLPVRFIEGILKYPSKYASGDTTCALGSGFPEDVALRIRDSVEMTREKMKQADAKKTVRKKLRWLNEVHMEEEEQEDHQLGVTTVPGASTGYHFTKHAWADVGLQVSHAGEVPPSRAPRREPPARGSRSLADEKGRGPATPICRRGESDYRDPREAHRTPSAPSHGGQDAARPQDSVRRRSAPARGQQQRPPVALRAPRSQSQRLWDVPRGQRQAMLGRQAPESGRVVRKPSAEHSRNPPASGNRRLPQPSQAPPPVRLLSGIPDVPPHGGLQSAAHLHVDLKAATEAAQTQRSTRGQQGLTDISLEEEKILLSLDRLNRWLHCVQECGGGHAGPRDLALIDPSSTKDVKVSAHHKQSGASSAGSRFHKQTGL